MDLHPQGLSGASATRPSVRARNGLLLIVGALLAVLGFVFGTGGVWLVALGGSWYYFIVGTSMVMAGIQLARKRASGAWLYAAVFIGTVAWTLWEVGLAFWPAVPRVGLHLVLACIVAMCLPFVEPRTAKSKAWSLAAGLIFVFLGGFALAFVPHDTIEGPSMERVVAAGSLGVEGEPGEWRHYGRTPAGIRYAPLNQINKDNVERLEVAWTFRTGDTPIGSASDQNTPLQVGDTLYVCTAHNKVFALHADSGKQRWVFDPKATNPVFKRCRGLGYYEADAVPSSTSPAAVSGSETQSCARRIMLTTVDARLIALDAETGDLCRSFGVNGTVDLTQGMGAVAPGEYFTTSAPTVAGNLVILGGWVWDNVAVDMPSGAVRAFSAESGELVWVWDIGNTALTGLPQNGQSYTRGTPNVWSTPAFDEALGLVYLPTGNPSPDYWGALRSPVAEAYGSSVVALDMKTGRERWKFQTVHHDLWDYDVASQPALYDIPDGNGGTIPALIQLTKRGQIFVLDRRDGTPITKVVERPVPQSGQAGDWTAPTQPYSIEMPTVGAERLKESDMWGLTAFDQLWCRIEYKRLRYEGEFTPPTTTRSLQWPGNYGGMNWGSATINATNDYLIINDIRLPRIVRLLPREEADRVVAAARARGRVIGGHDAIHSQNGTPFGVTTATFQSPLGVPCQRPPFGTMTAIDLKTRQIVWQRPSGTIEDISLLGIKTGLKVPLGMPTIAGSVTTESGLIFFAGTQDYYLRAMDLHTGEELWKSRLPVGAQATPMSYISPTSGRQYVLVSVGGAGSSPERGDYVIAYALPE